MKKASLLDDVKAGIGARRGEVPWYLKAPKAVMEELDSIKRAWLDGQIATTKTQLAFSISRALKSRGISIGHSGVLAWLEKA
jgi:hypothetical protein